jgi:uncharacterized secreted protein with C-terminal beta-propeller domain
LCFSAVETDQFFLFQAVPSNSGTSSKLEFDLDEWTISIDVNGVGSQIVVKTLGTYLYRNPLLPVVFNLDQLREKIARNIRTCAVWKPPYLTLDGTTCYLEKVDVQWEFRLGEVERVLRKLKTPFTSLPSRLKIGKHDWQSKDAQTFKINCPEIPENATEVQIAFYLECGLHNTTQDASTIFKIWSDADPTHSVHWIESHLFPVNIVTYSNSEFPFPVVGRLSTLYMQCDTIRTGNAHVAIYLIGYK